jgi:hypothetical protein
MRAAVRCVSNKRFIRPVIILLMTLVLSACAASVLVGNAQSRLLWSFLQPLVGFNPHEMNLLESPLIKPRMQALLGSHYDSTVKMLRTANQLQQEGALFYLVSRYAPDDVKKLTDKAGFVWNADTNQIAVLLIENGLPRVFSESTHNAIEQLVPQWPGELKEALTDAEGWQRSLQARTEETMTKAVAETLAVEGLQKPLQQILTGESAEQRLKEALEDSSVPLLQQPATLPEATKSLESLLFNDSPGEVIAPSPTPEPAPSWQPEHTARTPIPNASAPAFSQEREADFLRSLEREEAELTRTSASEGGNDQSSIRRGQ